MSTDINVSNLLPATLWAQVGDYMGEQECAQRLDPVLDEAVKSERFKHRVKVENDKNLRVFWDSLRFGAANSDWRKISLPNFFEKFADCLDPEDVAFGSSKDPLPKDSPATMDSIRKIVQNPIVQQTLFPAVYKLTYHSDHEGAPSMLIKELNGLVNLDRLVLHRTVLTNGLGTFATPLDLRDLPNLRLIEIDNTNLRDEDLLLSHRIDIRSQWELSQNKSYIEFFPPLTTFAGWKDLILNLPQDLCGLIGRFFTWLRDCICCN